MFPGKEGMKEELCMNDQAQDQLISDLAHDLVTQISPQELPLFRANSTAYFQNPEKTLKGQKGKDEMLGFGAGEAITFMTPIILAVTTEVISFISQELKSSLETESSSFINDAVKGLFKKFHSTDNEKKERAKIPPLTPKQLTQVKKLAIQKAHQLKLADDKAILLADLITGSLAVAS
jgi:hypothetical protein